jgi:predicted  nucleic acid-binding Zn-ribbon protein
MSERESEIENLHREMSHQLTARETLSQSLTSALSRMSRLENELQPFKAINCEREISEIRATLSSLKLQDSLSEFKTQIENLHSEIGRQSDGREVLSLTVTSSLGKVSQFEGELKTFATEITQIRSILKSQDSLTDLKTEVRRFGSEIDTLKTELRRLSSDLANLKLEVSRQSGAREVLSQTVTSTHGRLSHLEVELQPLKTNSQKFSAEISQIQSDLSALKSQDSQTALSDLKTEIHRMKCEVEALRPASVAALKLSTDVAELRTQVSSFQKSVPHPPVSWAAPGPVWNPPPPVRPPGFQGAQPIDSKIFSEIPALFNEFKGKGILLLWRGTRDGFRAIDFHSRCDRKPNTLVVIMDTEGFVFGGFTPVEWESSQNDLVKGDPSRKSFLFTWKNPWNVPPRKFALKADKQGEAILCLGSRGPRFGDIGVADACNVNSESGTWNFGLRYKNDTGKSGETFFTGGRKFQVAEIEVFQIMM